MLERCVPVVKKMSTIPKDFGQDSYLVMLEGRNILVDGLATPAQLVCSNIEINSTMQTRKVKDKKRQEQMMKVILNKRQKNQENQIKYYDHNLTTLKDFHTVKLRNLLL